MVTQMLFVSAVMSLALVTTSLLVSIQSGTEERELASPRQADGNGILDTAVTPSSRTSGQSSNESDNYFNLRVPALNSSTLTLGYLVEYRAMGVTTSRDWKQVSGALGYALDVVNKEGLGPGYKLTFVMRDTHMRTTDSLMSMSHLWRDDVSGFIASPTSCQNEAMLAGAWNLPILSYLCHSDKVMDRRDYRTLIRTFPPADSIVNSVISLLKHFSWNKFSIIYGKMLNSRQYEMVAQRLRSLATEHGLTVNHFRHYQEPLLPCDNASIFRTFIQQTYADTRIYLLIGSLNAVVNFTDTLSWQGLVDTGLYQVIYVEALENIADEPNKYFKMTYHNGQMSFLNVGGARCLLVVKSSYHQGYRDFYNIVRQYNSKPPFNFMSPGNWEKRIPQHASHLYDAIILYANAVRQVISEGGNFRDGRAIAGKILGQTYTSIQGYMAKIDKEGNTEGNFTVLALQQLEANNQSLSYAMIPVANFLLSEDGELPKFHMYRDSVIQWVSGQPPAAEPPCGYRGQNCVRAASYIWEITGGISSGLVLAAVVISLLIYRYWRCEKEIEGLLWKIDGSMIQFSKMAADSCNKTLCPLYGRHGSPACCGKPLMSMESRNSLAQVCLLIGKYKGQIVAVKSYSVVTTVLTRREKMEMKMMRELLHTNVNTFIGACLESSVLSLVSVYCHKGSLQDVLENDDMKLENVFISSLIKDLTEGMLYIHNSELIFHGNLKSPNCLVTSRWTLQVADFGLLDIRCSSRNKEDHYTYYRNFMWKAPEILRSHIKGSQSADVYAFSIILHEIFGRAGPYGGVLLDPKEIVRRVAAHCVDGKEPFRPPMTNLDCEDCIKDLMTACWSENPSDRPHFQVIWRLLKPMRAGIDRNIFDHMLAMMEKYQEHLEDLVSQRTQQLNDEKKKTEDLLYRMLPQSVAEQLKGGETVAPEVFDSVTVYFSDICGFTILSAKSTPMQIVNMLNDLYTCFDSIIKHFDVYKVETIGDAYMVVSGLPIRNGYAHVTEIASMALTLLEAIRSFKIRHRPDELLKLRIGIHSGPCVAGVVGLTMPRYTLFGDTINTASRIESHGQALRIHCSAHTKKLLEVIGGFHLQERGYIHIKGKGRQLTYWLVGSDDIRCSKLQLQQPSPVPESARLQCRVSPHRLTDRGRLQHQRCGILFNAQSQNLVVSSQCVLAVNNNPQFQNKSCSAPNVARVTHKQFLNSVLTLSPVTSSRQSLNSVLTQSPVTSSRQSLNSVLTQSPVTSSRQSLNSVLTQSPVTSSRQSLNSVLTQSPVTSSKQSLNSVLTQSHVTSSRHSWNSVLTQSHVTSSRQSLNSVLTQSHVTSNRQSLNSVLTQSPVTSSRQSLNSVLTQSPVTSSRQSLNSVLTQSHVTSSRQSLNSVLTQSPMTSNRQCLKSRLSPLSVNSQKWSLSDVTLLPKNSCLQRLIDQEGNSNEASSEPSLLIDSCPLPSVNDAKL